MSTSLALPHDSTNDLDLLLTYHEAGVTYQLNVAEASTNAILQLPSPSKQLDKDGFSSNQWSIGFDDVKKVESQSQMYILKSLVHEDDKKRVEKWFGDDSDKKSVQKSNTTNGNFQENVKYPQIGERSDNEPSYDGLINRRDQKLWDEQQRKMKLEQEAMDKQQDEKLQEQYRQSVSIDGLKKSNKPISRGW
jgi:hypothetical protein